VKITMNIDCTPEEARSFLGLPDLKPIQDRLMQEMQERMMTGMQAADPQELLKSWFPATTGFDQMQAFFAQLAGTKPK
jgi:Family of unknown function (DUF6489)